MSSAERIKTDFDEISRVVEYRSPGAPGIIGEEFYIHAARMQRVLFLRERLAQLREVLGVQRLHCQKLVQIRALKG